MFKRNFVCLLFIILYSVYSYAQLPASTESRVLLRYEKSFYGQLHTQGWGLGYRTGYNLTAMKKRMLDVSFYTMKHPKEVRISNSYMYITSKSYIYGKMNHFFLLQGSVGSQRTINEKPYWGGVEIRTFFSTGISLGFTKPIYLYIFPNNSLEKYDPEEHFYDNIFGRGPFLKGFDELKLHPGLYIKAGVNFEHGFEETRVRALEAGLMLSAFLKPIEIMSFTDNYNLFLNFYVSYHIGSRGN